MGPGEVDRMDMVIAGGFVGALAGWIYSGMRPVSRRWLRDVRGARRL